MTKQPKPKPCKVCKTPFVKRRAFEMWCSPECGLELVKAKQAKEVDTKAKAERKADKAKREAMKTRGDWIAETQTAFNRVRRLEEHAKGMTCISCQRPRHEIEGTDGWKPGGAWDAGHFQSVGRKPELRFEPLNVWLQCKSCNAGSSKYAKKSGTVEAAFEANLRALIGDEKVDWLKGPHAPLKLTIPDLKAIRDEYRAKANALMKVSE
jgi:ribosomal protein L37AE/L43A